MLENKYEKFKYIDYDFYDDNELEIINDLETIIDKFADMCSLSKGGKLKAKLEMFGKILEDNFYRTDLIIQSLPINQENVEVNYIVFRKDAYGYFHVLDTVNNNAVVFIGRLNNEKNIFKNQVNTNLEHLYTKNVLNEALVKLEELKKQEENSKITILKKFTQ